MERKKQLAVVIGTFVLAVVVGVVLSHEWLRYDDRRKAKELQR